MADALARRSLAAVSLAALAALCACSRSAPAPSTSAPTPVVPLTHATLTGTLCTTVRLPAWLTCTAPTSRTHTIVVSEPGPMTLNVDYQYVGDYYPNSLTFGVACNGSVLLERQFGKPFASGAQLPPGTVGTGVPFRIKLLQPCSYELRLSDFIADTKGGSQTVYRIDVDYPE